MKILHISLTEAAGVPYRMMTASRECGHTCNAVTFSQQLFPGDVVAPTWGRFRKLFDAADVVHVHTMNTYAAFEPELRNKPHVLLIHGSPDHLLKIEPDCPHVVSTPDLLLHFANAAYLPSIVLPGELTPSPSIGSGPVRIFQSYSPPSKERVLFDNVLKHIISRLPGKIEHVHPDRIVQFSAHMQNRGSCHINFDQMTQTETYGLESLEGLAQGTIPINNSSEGVLNAFEQTVGARPPFAIARNGHELAAVLIELFQEALQYPTRFEERRALGPEFIRQHYQPGEHVDAWISAYESVLKGNNLMDAHIAPPIDRRSFASLDRPLGLPEPNEDTPVLQALNSRIHASPDWASHFPSLPGHIERLIGIEKESNAA